ncbi:hypothetical protein AVEN_163275-1 [Araneus ventricosus]|uniref:Uncharacterized protein n=1 Tax=Araneus ventricosus TaxID=182803 RepID=A0A4Y2H0C2_ARAVE|nr:hypothetical protein AVEN_163275-1 [Araneus ventricosus]
MQQLPTRFRWSWEVFHHLAYGPDPHLKRFLQCNICPVTTLRSLATDSFGTGVQKLVSRYDKCFSSDGSYVERMLYLFQCMFPGNNYVSRLFTATWKLTF